MGFEFRVKAQGLGIRVWGLEIKVYRVQGLGFRV